VTVTTAEVLIHRAAIGTAPTTADETTRSVDLVISSGTEVAGQILTCTPAAVSWGPAPVPVLLSHENKANAMAGRIVSIRFEGGQLIGRAQFTDAPAAEQGWQLARSGTAVSVGAYYAYADTTMQGNTEVVMKWRLGEVSLVPMGADRLALTRSAPTTQTVNITTNDMDNITGIENINADAIESEGELSKAEANRQLTIERSAALANLTREEAAAIIASTSTTKGGLMAVIERHAAGLSQSSAGHPARVSLTTDSTGGLEGEIQRALSGARLDQPLWLSLRSAGIGKGNDGASVWRSALAGGGEGRWLSRSMAVVDLPNLLTSTGNRRLMERFLVADAGVRIAASVRQLQDYRAAGIIDAGMIGTAKEVKEGGEVTFSSVDEVAATYKPARYALGLSFTPQALANDDLSALDTAISELAEAMLDTEATALVDLLEGASLGRNAPDGKSLFHADHANVVTPGPLSIEAIGSAVAKLRNQKSLGGRYISTEPAAIIVSPGFETTARQLLSGAIQAATSAAVNPWANLEIAVEPRLSGSFAYVVGTGRKALELGRLTSGPTMTTEVDFSTSCYRAKSEHVFGAIVAEHRNIVRLATAA
jgi:hypothetical protein